MLTLALVWTLIELYAVAYFVVVGPELKAGPQSAFLSIRVHQFRALNKQL